MTYTPKQHFTLIGRHLRKYIVSTKRVPIEIIMVYRSILKHGNYLKDARWVNTPTGTNNGQMVDAFVIITSDDVREENISIAVRAEIKNDK